MAAAVAAAVVMAAAATVVTAVTAAVVMAAAAATARGLEVFGRHIAHGQHRALDAHVPVDELMIEVHLDILRSHVYDKTLDAHAVGSHHRQTHTLADMLLVKLAVNLEDTALELDDLLGIVVTESLVGLGHDVIFVAGLEAFESLLQRLDKPLSQTEDDALGLVGRHLVHKLLRAVGIDFIEIKNEFDILAGLDFFHNLQSMIN